MRMQFVATFRQWISRLPIFLLGIYCGKLSYLKVEINRLFLLLITNSGYIALIILKTMIKHPLLTYLYYPVRTILALSIVVTIILVMEIIERKLPRLKTVFESLLSWFGGLTLELYLLHQSYLILFDYPYRLYAYITVAFLLPTASAAVISLIRKQCKRTQEA